MRQVRVAAVVGFVSVLFAMTAAVAAWACVPSGGSSSGSGKKLVISPARVRPGGTVTVSALMVAGTAPIEVRLNAPGPSLLATLSSDQAGDRQGSNSTATFVVSPDTPPGRHALVAFQRGARWDPTVLEVARADGTVPEPGSRTTSATGPGGLAPMLLGVGVLGLAAAAWSVRAGRRKAGPTMVSL